jgi:diadenosine tetraphosphate (Ap4A) HIT family hydrolase
MGCSFALLQRVKALLDIAYQPQGYNVGWNCGQVGGQSVFHAHLHVIPRYQDEPFAGRGIRYWLKQVDNSRG